MRSGAQRKDIAAVSQQIVLNLRRAACAAGVGQGDRVAAGSSAEQRAVRDVKRGIDVSGQHNRFHRGQGRAGNIGAGGIDDEAVDTTAQRHGADGSVQRTAAHRVVASATGDILGWCTEGEIVDAIGESIMLDLRRASAATRCRQGHGVVAVGTVEHRVLRDTQGRIDVVSKHQMFDISQSHAGQAGAGGIDYQAVCTSAEGNHASDAGPRAGVHHIVTCAGHHRRGAHAQGHA